MPTWQNFFEETRGATDRLCSKFFIDTVESRKGCSRQPFWLGSCRKTADRYEYPRGKPANLFSLGIIKGLSIT